MFRMSLNASDGLSRKLLVTPGFRKAEKKEPFDETDNWEIDDETPSNSVFAMQPRKNDLKYINKIQA